VETASALSRPRCPTLGIVGAANRTGARLMERALEAVPGSRLEVVWDSFDPTNLCQPDEFSRLPGGFLREIGW
jgi:hypothetical protein